jgi:hypothetical protein
MTITVECPHPDCRGQIKIGAGLPAGVYDCICRTVEVRLEWSADGPSLALATGCSCRCHQTVQPGLVPCPGCAQPEGKRPEPPAAGAPAMVSATPTSGPPGKHEDLAPTVPEEHA